MPSFKMGDICYCKASKDIIKITNGIEREGTFTPTEAIAFRLLGFRKTRKGMYPRVGWTYRAVNPESLTVTTDSAGIFAAYFEGNCLARVERKYVAGRV